jgi:hypothetical protein
MKELFEKIWNGLSKMFSFLDKLGFFDDDEDGEESE